MSDNLVYSDFWLEDERYSDYIDPKGDNTDEMFCIDLIKLASVRRIISNYVDILTGESIPVYFKSQGDSYNIGGKEIYITTEIKRKKDFDKAVGLALHEAAHTVKTDFDALTLIPFKTPKSIWDFGRKNNISKISLERFIKSIVNVVEDWYIDDWVMSTSPGYVGYYEASYNDCFNTPEIDQLLIGNNYRFPSLHSYEFRIINFPNPLTDLQALPGLEDIAKTVKISKISRLETTKDRIDVAIECVHIVMKNVQSFHSKNIMVGSDSSSGKSSRRIDVDQFFNKKNDGDGGKNSSSDTDESSSKTDTDKTIKDVADALSQKPKKEDGENKSMVSQVNKSPEKEIPKEIQKIVDSQLQYVNGNSKKKELDPVQKNLLDIIEKHGIVLVYVPVHMEGNESSLRVGCIVVKKFTMDLIESGQEMFPMVNAWKDERGILQPDSKNAEAVKRGILLGSKLGRKLVLRREINTDKIIRKRRGKINRRLLYSAGFDAEDFFEKINIHKFSKGSLHITVDASTSMSGEKWFKTITMCVAVCKAASMVDNLHITVSFRASKTSKGVEMPYILLAYDSQKDKFSKVKNLFKFLNPCGCTPEGLAYSAIMDLFTKSSPDEEDRYFLNISDGEPFFTISSPLTKQVIHYGDKNGVEHTKNQVCKIRRQGINVMSYYIQSENVNGGGGHDTKKNFQVMYGKDARFIQPDEVLPLAKTINELFLKER